MPALIQTVTMRKPTAASGFPWAPILAPQRAYDWGRAGVRGGIPTNFTKDGSTIAAGASTSTVNSRIAAAGTNTYVELGAGSFSLGGLLIGRSRVILRGQGADSTIVTSTGVHASFGLGASIAIPSDFNDYNSPAHQANWTAHYNQGDTVITISGTSGLVVGDLLSLSQENDLSGVSGYLTVGSAVPAISYDGSGGGGGNWGGSADREQIEIQEVVAINGNDITIYPGLRCPNWVSAKNPKVAWTGTRPLQFIGIENLMLDLTSSGSTRGMGFMGVKDCWVKGVKTRFAGRCHAQFLQSMNCEYDHGFLFEGVAHASQSYGVEFFDASDCRVLNNIAIRVTSPWMCSGAAIGCVRAYNYSDLHTFAGDWMQESLYFHAAGTLYVLDEGNHTNGIIFDQVHGPSSLCTAHRNRLTGWETGKAQQTVPYHDYTLSRFNNATGNILGTSGIHTQYECAATAGTNPYSSHYVLGFGDNGSNGGGSNPPDDTQVKTTLLRWGNWDQVNGTRFVSGEVPSGITNFANPIPGTTTLPTSYFLLAKPSWFGSAAWPPIGPDVTGGDVSGVGGHVYSIPSKVYYDAQTKDGQGEISFNANAAYGV